MTLAKVFAANFLGNSPTCYKLIIVVFLVSNPLLLLVFGPVITAWALLAQFIFTLAMALKCYPLQPGGLLAFEAVLMGLASAPTVAYEVSIAYPVILLLIFMVAGIYFMKDLLLLIFTKLLLGVHSKIRLSMLFTLVAALLSAFLDALTVTAVVIAVGVGFYNIYHRSSSQRNLLDTHDYSDDSNITHKEELENFRAFLRSLIMHALVGTTLGGVCTIVGEPQNLLIASRAGWNFGEFALRMSPLSAPLLVVGLLTSAALELSGRFGYGARLSPGIRAMLTDLDRKESHNRTTQGKAALIIQAFAGLWLVVGLALHLTEVGIIGLTVIVLTTAFNGIVTESQLGKAFEEALPFTALLVVFFVVVAVIADQQLFTPVISTILTMQEGSQAVAFYIANGVLSAISDNVFVATVYINEIQQAYLNNEISRNTFEKLAVAINVGTNIPSIATPNGQAAFLFLLTSSLAPLLRLSYGTMVWMALPYTLCLGTVALLGILFWQEPVIQLYYEMGWLLHYVPEAVPAIVPGAH